MCDVFETERLKRGEYERGSGGTVDVIVSVDDDVFLVFMG